MDADKIIQYLDKLFEQFKGDYTADIENRVDLAIANYRVSVLIGDKWCCKAMEEIASKVFGVNKRTTDDFTFQNRLAIRNNHVVYCPFCGVKL